MTLSLHGKGIAQGVAIGHAHVLRSHLSDKIRQNLEGDSVEDELERFISAVNQAKAHLQNLQRQLSEHFAQELAEFIDTHLLMLEDGLLIDGPLTMIREKRFTAEWALSRQRDELVKVFEAMDDPYLRTRKDDVEHVVRQIQHHLQLDQQEEFAHSSLWMHGKIIVTQDLAPAEILLYRDKGVGGFVTECGSPMSHTAILLKSLGVPTLLGVRNATHYLYPDELLILDESSNTLLADPSPLIIQQFRAVLDSQLHRRIHLDEIRTQPAQTRDGERVQLLANIELANDVTSTLRAHADGVGLYRTEFLFLNRNHLPDEEEHLAAYREVVRGLRGLPITIRTLDIGADKPYGPISSTCCANPALGLRAVRLCLKEPALFKPQLRAILRASVEGRISIMIPMLTHLSEVRAVRRLLEEAKRELRQEGHAYDPEIPLGGMIEVPAAALMAAEFAAELDFLSIGTNDLIQYCLAVDRIDENVQDIFDPLHPSVIRLIDRVIAAAQNYRIPISMCGEMSGHPDYVALLLALGLRHFSMSPNSILEIKARIQQMDIGELQSRLHAFGPRDRIVDWHRVVQHLNA